MREITRVGVRVPTQRLHTCELRNMAPTWAHFGAMTDCKISVVLEFLFMILNHLNHKANVILGRRAFNIVIRAFTPYNL